MPLARDITDFAKKKGPHVHWLAGPHVHKTNFKL